MLTLTWFQGFVPEQSSSSSSGGHAMRRASSEQQRHGLMHASSTDSYRSEGGRSDRDLHRNASVATEVLSRSSSYASPHGLSRAMSSDTQHLSRTASESVDPVTRDLVSDVQPFCSADLKQLKRYREQNPVFEKEARARRAAQQALTDLQVATLRRKIVDARLKGIRESLLSCQ